MYLKTAFTIITLFYALAVHAQPCDVVIMGAPATHYPSIGSALATVPAGTGKTLNVSGICKEKVTIQNHVGVTLQGSSGSVLQPPDANTQRFPTTLQIRESDNISVRGLTVRGTANVTGAVSIWNSRVVEFRDLTIENGGNEGGVWVIQSFGVNLNSVIIQNNGNGIRVDGPGGVNVQGMWSPGQTGTAIVQNNGTGAIVRTGGILSLRGDAIVRNNNVGIATNGGNFLVCCREDVKHPRVESNRFQGLLLRGGDVAIAGPFEVQDNGANGFTMFGTEARISDAIVRRNGAGSPPGTSGGMFMLSGRVELTRVEISANAGAGLVLSEGARGRVLGCTITGNGGEGVDVQMLSVAGFSSFSVIRNNKGFDVRCSPNSHGHGFDDEIGRMQCPGFNRGPDPTPGGED